MTKHLITLNTGNYLCPNSRASHEAAAKRWDATYTAFTKPWGELGHLGPFGPKLELDRLPFDGGDRVMWIDGDTLIRADCPSPFDLVPPGTFGGVPNVQGDTHGPPELAVQVEWWTKLAPRYLLGDCPPCNALTYINGGVLVFDLAPHHQSFWQSIRDAFPPELRASGGSQVHPMFEQTALNLALLGARVKLLPTKFNRLGGTAWHHPALIPMRAYIYHLANLGDLRGNKRAKLESINWRLVPADSAESAA